MTFRDDVTRAWRCGRDECELLVLTLHRDEPHAFELRAQYVGQCIRSVARALPFVDEASARVFVLLLFPLLVQSRRREREWSTFVASWY